MRTLFEAIENKKSNNYEMVLKINEQTINLKFDNGAAYTVISASVLDENFSDERAEYFEKILLEKAQQYEQDNELKAPFEKTFVSASGNQIKGYLVDSPNVTIGNYKNEHFYYYFIPQNKRPIALLGNDFLRFCEYTHKIEGNIYITKIDMVAYKSYYENAIDIDEISALIDEMALNEFDIER